MKRTMRQILMLLLAAALLVTGMPALAEEAASADVAAVTPTTWLMGQYQGVGTKDFRSWKFPFRDDFFRQDAAVYQHELARSTLGMALSAFRNTVLTAQEQDDHVISYLTQAGFDHFVSEGYDQPTSVDTVSSVIASKTIDDFTLVAVAVCGGNYSEEWLSNFKIGDETRHVGFNEASQKVQARIRDYLKAQNITGKVKLWTGGYSRGAAITNLTAADMTDSGLFDAVYAYCFATPRVTKQPGDYNNIFNILGKFDPVPLVPLGEWGYERNGTSLYTPAQETDSGYPALKSAASRIHELLDGTPLSNNVEINSTIHTILDYLYTILPTSKVYAEHMQDIMMKAWDNRSLPNLSSLILQLMEDEELLNDTQKQEVEQLLDYLSVVTYNNVTGTTDWSDGAGLASNLAYEHIPDVYVSWMFSTDDPNVLFTGQTSFVRLFYTGSSTAIIIDGKGHFILQADAQGKVSYTSDEPAFEAAAEPLSMRPDISCVHKGTQMILSLPKDEVYVVYLTADTDQTIMYYGAEYSADQINATVSDVNYIDMKQGEMYLIASLTETPPDETSRLWGSSDLSVTLFDDETPYTPSLMEQTENNNVFHLTFIQMIWVAAGAIVLVPALIVLTIVLIVRHHRRKKRQKLPAVVPAKDVALEEASEKQPQSGEDTTLPPQ